MAWRIAGREGGRPPLWLITTHHAQAQAKAGSYKRATAGALASGQWPVGPRTHRHTEQQKSARARHGAPHWEMVDANTTKEGCAQRGVRARGVRHAFRMQTRERRWHAEREGASQHARTGGAEWSEEKRRQERHPPASEHTPRARRMTCSTAAVSTTQPPRRPRTWPPHAAGAALLGSMRNRRLGSAAGISQLKARSSPSSHPERFASEAAPSSRLACRRQHRARSDAWGDRARAQ